MKEAKILASMTELASSTFSSCSSLEKVELSDTITKLNNGAFSNCSSLEFTLTDQITYIGSQTFYTMKRLIIDSYSPDLSVYSNYQSYRVSITDNVTYLAGSELGKLVNSYYLREPVILATNHNYYVEEGCINAYNLYGYTGWIWVNENGWLYSFDPETKTAKLIYQKGKQETVVLPASIEVVSRIPENSGVYTVIGIGDNAFIDNTTFRYLEVKQPDLITDVSRDAFATCSWLESINGQSYQKEVNQLFPNFLFTKDLLVNTKIVLGTFNLDKTCGKAELTGIEGLSITFVDQDENGNSGNQQWIQTGESDLGYYELLTGQAVTLSVTANSSAADGSKYRIYFDSEREYITTGFGDDEEKSYVAQLQGETVYITVSSHTDTDGRQYIDIPMMYGASVQFFVYLNCSNLSPQDGGNIAVYAEDISDKNSEETISSPEDLDYMYISWKTEAGNYTSAARIKDYPQLSGNGSGGYKVDYVFSTALTFSNIGNALPDYGQDPAKDITCTLKIRLPEILKWSTTLQEGNCRVLQSSGYTYINNGETYAEVIRINSTMFKVKTATISLDPDDERLMVLTLEMEDSSYLLSKTVGSKSMTIYCTSFYTVQNDVDFNVSANRAYSVDWSIKCRSLYGRTYEDSGILNSSYNLSSGIYTVSSLSYSSYSNLIYDADYTPSFSVQNSSISHYYFDEHDNDGLITYKYDKYSYIDNQQIADLMFTGTYRSGLTISIQAAIVSEFNSVYSTAGTKTAYKYYGNSRDVAYEVMDVVVTEQDGSVLFTAQSENKTIEKLFTKQTDFQSFLDTNLCYADGSLYTVVINLNKVYKGVVYAGTSTSYSLKARVKSPFIYDGEIDWRNQYNGSVSGSTTISQSFKNYWGSPVSNTLTKSIQTRDYTVNKSATINGVSVSESPIQVGDIVNYQITVSSHIYALRKNIPVVDYLTGCQTLLVPYEKNKTNTELSDLKITEIDGVQYYLMNKPGIYHQVWVGNSTSTSSSTSTILMANEIVVEEGETRVYWYFSSISYNYTYIRYQSVVDKEKCAGQANISVKNTVYVNDRESSRIFENSYGEWAAFSFSKIAVDPETGEELGKKIQITKGSITKYLLTINDFNEIGYISGSSIKDYLPQTFGVDGFNWVKNENISLSISGNCILENNLETDWSIHLNDEGRYVLEFGSETYIKFSEDSGGNGQVVIEITLNWPEDERWNTYRDLAYTENITNEFEMFGYRDSVLHEIQRPAEANLQKGVVSRYFQTYGRSEIGDRNYYSTGWEDYFWFYVFVSNDGTTNLYLNPLTDELEGLTYVSLSNYTRTSEGFSYNLRFSANDRETEIVQNSTGAVVSGSSVTFTITLDSNHYDSEYEKYYLNPGESTLFFYTCKVNDEYAESHSVIGNTIRMEYFDYLHESVKVSKDYEITPKASANNTGINRGKCYLENSSSAAVSLCSAVTMTKGNPLLSFSKKIESVSTASGSSITYQGMAPADGAQNWLVTVENQGEQHLNGFTFLDEIQQPYDFNSTIILTLYLGTYSSTAEISVPVINTGPVEGKVSIFGKSYTTTVNHYSNSNTGTNCISVYIDNFGIPYETDNEKLNYVTIQYSTKNASTLLENKSFSNISYFYADNPDDLDETLLGKRIYADDSDDCIGLSSRASFNAYYGYATVSQKTAFAEDGSYVSSYLTDETVLLLETDKFDVRYQLETSMPGNVRTYELIMIDTLPYIGDTISFSDTISRDSETDVSFNLSNLDLDVYGVNSSNNRVEIDPKFYKVEYSSKTSMSSSDWNGDSDGWTDNIDDLGEDARSIRVVIRAIESEDDDGNVQYECIPDGLTVTVAFNALVDSESHSGTIAYNDFGYQYRIINAFGKPDAACSAMPEQIGVMVPGNPVLQKKIVYQDNNSYPASQQESFTFLIHEGEAKESYDDFSDLDSFTICSINIDEGSSVSDKVLLENLKKYEYKNGSFVETASPWKWVEGNSYTIVELETGSEFKFKKWNNTTVNAYTFVQNAKISRKLTCENVLKTWDINITKTEQFRPDTLLPGAKFALYSKTENKVSGVDDKAPETIEAQGITWYLLRTGITDEDGHLLIEDLEDDSYVLLEYEAPEGYYLEDNTVYFLYQNGTEWGVNNLTVENISGRILPSTGGFGSQLYTITGGTMAAFAGSSVLYKRRKTKRRERGLN